MTGVADSSHAPSLHRAKTFRRDIEGLRGIAVLLVVAYHCRLPGVSAGFIGVDVFFVLSGYLITSLLVDEAERTSRISLIEFYARRMRRLLPAAAATLSVTMLAGALVFAPQELTFAARAARAAAVYLSNVFFAANAADYFGPRVESNPVLHTWSLSAEEQFYVFWPMLVMAALQWWRSRRALVAILAVVSCASLVICIATTLQGGTFAFYSLPARAWEFGAGGLAGLIGVERLSRPWRSIGAIGWIGLALVLGSAIVIDRTMAFPGWLAALPVAGTCCALMAGAQAPDGSMYRVLSVPPLQTLGRLSYSWYLWHWPVLVFADVLVPGISLPGRVAAAGMALLLAAFTHRCIENPIRFNAALVRRPRLSIALGAALSLLTLACGMASLRYAAVLARTPDMAQLSAARADIARIDRDGCVSPGPDDQVRICKFGDEASTTQVVLFGDSHAIQWFNPLETIARQRSWSLTTILKSGCSAVDVAYVGPELDAAACARWRAKAIRQILGLGPSAVILGSATNRPDLATPSYVEDVRNATQRTVNAFAGGSSRIVMMRDVPRFSFDVVTCLTRARRLGSLFGTLTCEQAAQEALSGEVAAVERAALAAAPTAVYLDLTDVLCPDGICRSTVESRPMYRDDNHLTGSYAESLNEELARGLVPAIENATIASSR